MPFWRNNDTGMELLAILLIGFMLLLLFMLLFQNLGGNCPEGAVQCDASLSACGCCVEDGFGNLVEYCETGSCPEGFSLNPSTGQCCNAQNPANCITNQKVCVNPLSCESSLDCCEGYSCSNGRCAPCEAGLVCDPQDPNSCCSGFMCTAEGTCESCNNVACASDSDCCGGYECSNEFCISCERTCAEDDECCNGWNCVAGACESCYRSCSSDVDCCDGDACIDGSCSGCEQGAYCDEDKPCCNGFECNMNANACESCDRSCSFSEDCCDDGVCSQGSCAYAESCEGFPCSNPGEACIVCSGNDCIDCADDTVCAWNDAASMFTCQSSGNCGEGQVACSAEDCASGCCDALTGECSVCASGHPCENVEGCSCCEQGAQNIVACPEGTFLCEGRGCAVILPECEQIGGMIICAPSVEAACPSGAFECSDNPDACCMYILPRNAIPDGVVSTTSDVCASGYQDAQQGSCCTVSYEQGDGVFNYAFDCGGNSYYSSSQVSPYEYPTYSMKVLPEDYCDNIAATCPEGQQCFADPVVVQR